MAKYWSLMRQTMLCLPALGLHSVKKIAVLCLKLWLLFNITPAYAQDIQTILVNVRSIILPLTAMVLMISFVIGIIMIFRALGHMKKFGTLHHQSQTGSGSEVAGPLVYLVVGAVLVYLPTSSDVIMNSLFGTSASIFQGSNSIDYSQMGQGATILSYAGSATLIQQWADLANTLILYMQFIGLISFIRGWVLISKLAQPGGGQQGNLGKGVTHIIGGVGLINIVGVFTIIRNTVMGS